MIEKIDPWVRGKDTFAGLWKRGEIHMGGAAASGNLSVRGYRGSVGARGAAGRDWKMDQRAGLPELSE